jgi:hypothetical protein
VVVIGQSRGGEIARVLAVRNPDAHCPQQPLQTLGRTLLESFPFVPLIGNVRISIAIFSYNGGLYFGVTGDYDSCSDIDVLTTGVERGVAELLRASRPTGRKREVAPKRPEDGNSLPPNTIRSTAIEKVSIAGTTADASTTTWSQRTPSLTACTDAPDD